jgi:transposase-like protein
MSSRKLSDSDKCDIIELYRQPGETTLTLASRYGVSSSTISRILKTSLSEHEYETLIQEKRSGRAIATTAELLPELPIAENRRPRKRSSAPHESQGLFDAGTQLSLLDQAELETQNEDDVDEIYQAEVSTLHEMLGEDLLDDDDIDDDEDDEDDDYDDDDLEDDNEPFISRPRKISQALVEVLPISNAELPRPCYIVVDRGGELITRPLGDFSELGKISLTEFQQRTLPVFDNHRVARRFSNRNQRVIKVPDGEMLQKTAPYLEAKGISRLLVDGQVYSL